MFKCCVNAMAWKHYQEPLEIGKAKNKGNRCQFSACNLLKRPPAAQYLRFLITDVPVSKSGMWKDCFSQILDRDAQFVASLHFRPTVLVCVSIDALLTTLESNCRTRISDTVLIFKFLHHIWLLNRTRRPGVGRFG